MSCYPKRVHAHEAGIRNHAQHLIFEKITKCNFCNSYRKLFNPKQARVEGGLSGTLLCNGKYQMKQHSKGNDFSPSFAVLTFLF